MSRRSIVILLLLALLGAWGVRRAFDRGRATPGPVASALNPGFCPRFGLNPPQRLPILHGAVSISFHGSELIAVDREGNVWTYYRGESNCNDPAPIKALAARTVTRFFPKVGLPRAVQRNAVLMNGQALIGVPLEFADPCATAGMKCVPLPVVGLDGVAALAAGDHHMLIVRADGSLWSSGMNDCGQLGREGGSGYPKYFERVSGMSNIVAVAAGMRNSMALDTKGVVWVWGSLSNPMLDAIPAPVPGNAYCPHDLTEWAAAHHLSGDGDDDPHPVKDLPRIQQISTYQATDFALDMEGRVWGWGFNSCGQLGVNPGRKSDPDFTDLYIVHPRLIEGLPPVHAIAAGKRHALALDAEGRVWAWGENADTELGQRLDLSKESSFACGNEHGQQGTLLAAFTTVPREVPGIGKVVAIAAGYNSSAAIDEHGDVWVWGRH